MRSLLETVYSTKLYSKRCEYICRRASSSLKGKYCRMWVELMRRRCEERKELEWKSEKMLSSLQRILSRILFSKLEHTIR